MTNSDGCRSFGATNFLPRSSRRLLLLLRAMMFALFATSCCSCSAAIPACVNDPASVSILQNTNLTYFEKVALFYASHDAEDNYSTSIPVAQHNSNSSSSVSTPPYLCPQLAPINVFIPGTYWNFYFDHSAVSDIQNATTEGVTCGLSCSSKSTGVSFDTIGNPLAYYLHVAYGPVTRIINGTSVTRNETYNTDNETTVFCSANVPNTTALDTVCTAYIQYNSTYSESGTSFAVPSLGQGEAAAILDPANTTLSAGVASTFSIWLPPSLTFCPWYYEAGFLPSDETFIMLANYSTSDYYLPRVAPSITIGFAFNTSTISGVSQTAATTIQFPLMGARCEIASPHPISGGVGVRYVGVVPSSTLFGSLDGLFLKNVTSYAMTLEYFNYAYFLPLLTVSAPGVALLNSTAELPTAPITYQGTMVPRLSRWWPLEDYTKPELSNIPRRCYSSSPKTVSNDPTTVYFPTLSCTCGTHVIMEEVVNATSFCCFMNTTSTPPAAAFVWPAFIEVYDAGAHWFTDTAGIIATPTPSRATTSGGGGTPSPGGGSSAHNDVSGSGHASSSSDGQSSSNGEDTTLILVISILAISAVVVAMVLVYFKWWKPRQESGGGSTMSDHRKHHHNDTATAPQQLLGVLSDPLLADGQLKSNNTALDMYEEANQMHDGLL
ncbi:membrane-associated protein, putative [Bodo saltans]|uniref:Membrane-associated protein, putative n=1 Tax=Bodo saltans TaxID=75058 RepID=A0A0S4J2Q5_BODSA|nr:membrane-associated protein, putative [Bodo saltans]|eukprot:CUG70992.1 membrane-associated protein, putative [Bodo saltans]